MVRIGIAGVGFMGMSDRSEGNHAATAIPKHSPFILETCLLSCFLFIGRVFFVPFL